MEQGAAGQRPAAAPSAATASYRRRELETTALYRVFQEHLASFEQQWVDEAEGRTLPAFVTEELRGCLSCGVLARGFAHLFCDACKKRHLVAFSCHGRGFCPSCMGRRMNEGAANLVDHVIPQVPVRQWVLTLPHPLRFPLAFDGRLLGGVYRPDGLDEAPVFHPAPAPVEADVEEVVHRARKRILRYLERRGAITVVTAPGDGELTVAGDEGLGESDPLLAGLLAAAVAGAPPAGPAQKRAPVRLRVPSGATAEPKGRLCAQDCGFNLHAATRVGANDREGRERLCRYVLRPPLANDHLHVLPDGSVRLELKRPWSDGTSSISLAPLALIARLAALVPPPRRHVVRYFGVLSSHSGLRAQIVPPPPPAPSAPAGTAPEAPAAPEPSGRRCGYIPWADLLRRTFAIEIVCHRCGGSLRLIALVKTEATIKKILTAMGLPAEAPPVHPARRPAPTAERHSRPSHRRGCGSPSDKARPDGAAKAAVTATSVLGSPTLSPRAPKSAPKTFPHPSAASRSHPRDPSRRAQNRAPPSVAPFDPAILSTAISDR